MRCDEVRWDGSVAVCEMLRGNKYLREVDVSHNRINWEGAMSSHLISPH